MSPKYYRINNIRTLQPRLNFVFPRGANNAPLLHALIEHTQSSTLMSAVRRVSPFRTGHEGD
ncbi:hypothetical protein E2C01_062413 [Portunus trituberculatus]|uniref:Uncharacterized protein n=1 Tax=Portunus trituberculatus TaxID=210409 RepID=A0A5B7HDZ5_PORTR|nr:hypothetical protein [Portunus trituberculatus]